MAGDQVCGLAEAELLARPEEAGASTRASSEERPDLFPDTLLVLSGREASVQPPEAVDTHLSRALGAHDQRLEGGEQLGRVLGIVDEVPRLAMYDHILPPVVETADAGLPVVHGFQVDHAEALLLARHGEGVAVAVQALEQLDW